MIGGLVACAALAAAAVVLSGRDDSRRATATALSSEGRELVGLLDKGMAATYHARYRSVLGDPRAQGTQMTMDVWRSGQLTRQEVAVQAQSARSRSATFQVPPQSFQCTQTGDGPWRCSPPGDARPVEPPESAIREELARGPIAARDDTIGGVPVRCFTFAPGGDMGETCLLPDGALARMTTESSRFELVAFTTTVSPDAFALPAAPG